MSDELYVLGVVSYVFRVALLAIGVLLAVIAVLDWATRTRRLNPFGAIARFMRNHVDPRLAGVERQVVRMGGQLSATPWWALVAYVVCAALAIALVDAVIGLVLDARFAFGRGAAGVLLLLVRWTFAFLKLALIVRVVVSWLPRLAYSRWLSWSFGATDWMLRPLRRVVPSLGVIDITPLVAYFGLVIVEWLVMSVLLAGFA
ncbi:MAG TPA: YggT family protein [Gemmatimonadaceae bacterium]